MIEVRDYSFIHRYFIAEKQESLLFLILGFAAILLSVYFFFFVKSDLSFFKGAAIPLVMIGIIQVTVGYTVYARSDKQRMDIAYKTGIEPKGFTKSTELPRMETVMKNFVIYRWVEIAFILSGFALILFFRLDTGRSFWYGLGIALAIQAALMLGADYFAEKRGAVYVKALKGLLGESDSVHQD